MRIENLRALTIAGAVALAVVPVVMIVAAEPALAGNHKQDGNGNDDGPGNSENAPGHDNDGPGNSENAPGHDDDGPGNSENAQDDDDVPDELGGLNAAHASELGFLNADPDSMVGQINTYREHLVALEDVRAQVMTAQDAYADAVEAYDGRDSAAIEAEIFALDPEASGYEDDLAQLNAELSDALAHEQALRGLQANLEDVQQLLDSAESEEDAALMALTGGETLSDEAYAQLMQLLEN